MLRIPSGGGTLGAPTTVVSEEVLLVLLKLAGKVACVGVHATHCSACEPVARHQLPTHCAARFTLAPMIRPVVHQTKAWWYSKNSLKYADLRVPCVSSACIATDGALL